MLISLCLLLILVCLPRFDFADVLGLGLGGPLPADSDQLHYIAMVQVYRGMPTDSSHPISPFTHRPLLPLVASVLPFAPMTALNVLNVAGLLFGLAALYLTLLRLGFSLQAAAVGGALYAVSSPTFYYGAIGRIDPAFTGMFTVACCALLDRRWTLFAVSFVLATGIRETSILLIPLLAVVLAAEGGGQRSRRVLIVATAAAVYLMLGELSRRLSLDPSPTGWEMSWGRFIVNVARPRAWITIPLGLSVQGALALVGLPAFTRAFGHDRLVTFCLVGLAGVLALVAYSWLVAWPDARFLWVAYPFTIPLALIVARRYVPALGAVPDVATAGRWRLA